MALEAFVPAALGTAAAPAPAPVLRGSAAQAPPSAAWSLVVPSAAVLTCGALAVGRRSRKSTATARRFFGGGSSPAAAPVKVESYRDLEDKWLGSADLGFDPLNLSVGSIAGVWDKAWDPANSAKSSAAVYYNYRESEVKHGRFAMVAFLAIFGEEADRSAVLHQLGVVGAEDKLDGTLGLDEVQAPLLLIGVGAQALAEYSKQRKEGDDDFTSVEYTPDRCPGDLGFDPLALAFGRADLKGMHNLEVNTGRLAMIGVTSFLIQESPNLLASA